MYVGGGGAGHQSEDIFYLSRRSKGLLRGVSFNIQCTFAFTMLILFFI